MEHCHIGFVINDVILRHTEPSTGRSVVIALSRSVILWPSARTRVWLPAVEAAGKLASPSTSRSLWPMLASACSSSGDTIEGIRFSRVSLEHLDIIYGFYLPTTQYI